MNDSIEIDTVLQPTSVLRPETVLGSLDVTMTPEIEDRFDAIYQVHQNPTP